MHTRARKYRRSQETPPHILPDGLLEGRVKSGGVRRERLIISGERIARFTGEFWTSKQRQASSLHEISYRACFKPQLPRHFIERLTDLGDLVYDPFMGRGTTIIEAAMLGRRVIGNDVNPLSQILTRPRLDPPTLEEVEKRVAQIRLAGRRGANLDLTMFYHPRTESEIVALRHYLARRIRTGSEDHIDRWIRMVATNRLTGHSRGFFSVYTLPPNQAASAENQKKINRARRQKPPYRDIKELMLRKTKSLLRDVSEEQRCLLKEIGSNASYLTSHAWHTSAIRDNSVKLTVTSPPFLDTVNYAQDNWLRCWFNTIDRESVERGVTQARTVDLWSDAMKRVFVELFRVTSPGGFVAFEVGEIRKRNLKLDEVVVPLGLSAGFRCAGVIVNQQQFTKTSNIWGVHNNRGGTNTNRIVLFLKPRLSVKHGQLR